jgi:hypothetical protein
MAVEEVGTVVVKRSEWLRGEGAAMSSLYRARDGKRCCIGFACRQMLGVTDEQMSDTEIIGGIGVPGMSRGLVERGVLPEAPPWARARVEPLALRAAYAANDEFSLPDAERERRITEWGANHGITFQFVD